LDRKLQRFYFINLIHFQALIVKKTVHLNCAR
jgi:hypothetical protein